MSLNNKQSEHVVVHVENGPIENRKCEKLLCQNRL